MHKYFAPYEILRWILESTWCTVYSALVKTKPHTSRSLKTTASASNKVISCLVAKWILAGALLALIIPGVGIVQDDDSLFCVVAGEVETASLPFCPTLSHYIMPQQFVPLQRDHRGPGLAMRAPPQCLVVGICA